MTAAFPIECAEAAEMLPPFALWLYTLRDDEDTRFIEAMVVRAYADDEDSNRARFEAVIRHATQQPRRPRPRPERHVPLLGRPEPSAPKCSSCPCSSTSSRASQAEERGHGPPCGASRGRQGMCGGTGHAHPQRGGSPSWQRGKNTTAVAFP